MPETQNRTELTAPRTERWVLFMACAFLPVMAALVAPEVARIPLLAVGGLTFVAGFVLMVRESRRARDSENLRQLVHTDME